MVGNMNMKILENYVILRRTGLLNSLRGLEDRNWQNCQRRWGLTIFGLGDQSRHGVYRKSARVGLEPA